TDQVEAERPLNMRSIAPGELARIAQHISIRRSLGRQRADRVSDHESKCLCTERQSALLKPAMHFNRGTNDLSCRLLVALRNRFKFIHHSLPSCSLCPSWLNSLPPGNYFFVSDSDSIGLALASISCNSCSSAGSGSTATIFPSSS